MIPKSVRMNGWMRYRDEQLADFGDGRLIAICGENGAGKSSIFDAITFALYGKHRLGKNYADKLISEDMDRLSVTFEFEAEHEGAMRRFLVRRSRGRKQGEREQGLWLGNDGADGEVQWAQVPGTEKEDTLERVLAQIIRLSAQAFTSSFMLQQGEATEFIDADPKPRFEIVSSLIGLDEYKRLEASARDAQRGEKKILDDLKTKLDQFAGYDAAARDRLRDDVKTAAAREAAATAGLDAARRRLADAKRYAERATEIAALSALVKEADLLIADASQIEHDAQTRETLARALETAGRVRAALADAGREDAAGRDAKRQLAAIDIAALNAASVSSAAAAAAARTAAAAAEGKRDVAQRAEREAADFLALATTIVEGRRRVEECDSLVARHDEQLAALPGLQSQADLLSRTKDALPALAALREACEYLEQVQQDAAKRDLALLQQQHAALVAEAREVELGVGAADAALATTRADDAAAQAQVAVFDATLRARKAASTEATCSRCGQAVDKKQALAEIKELSAEIVASKRHASDSAASLRAAEAACSAMRARQTEIATAIARLAPAIASAESLTQEATRAATAVEQRRASFAAAAPPELAQEAAPAFTAAAVAGVLHAYADAPKRAEALRARVEQLRGVDGQRIAAMAERERLRTRLTTDEANLNGRLNDILNAAAEHNSAKQTLGAAIAAFDGARASLDAALSREILTRDAAAAARVRCAELDAEIGRREAAAAVHRGVAETAAAGLGDVIGPQALAAPGDLLQTLGARLDELSDASARLEALTAARTDRAGWEGQRAAKQAEIDGIPEPHRVDESIAQAGVADLEQEAAAARELHAASVRDLTEIELRIEDVAAMKEQKATAELRSKRLRTLVKLLGKDGLQGALVTDALAQITSHANAFLQRITGGNLLLSIHQEGDTLELQATDVTCMTRPHPIKALSGSQKFRCAVAIASGIGQYAGAGGMRSIVIDEGFASLDQPSQQMMVEELKELATHMDKVIVVSHLEAFTDRANFPDQILVEAVGNASRITRSYRPE